MKNKALINPCLMIVLFVIFASCGDQLKTDNPPSGAITDIDGNVYHAVTIGTQTWMVENLKVTKLNDGTSIPNVTALTAWNNLTTPGYCWYNNDIANKKLYGALYNWYNVSTGKLCPTGWHVPSVTEWTTLINYLGGESVAGGKLKETGTTHWVTPNTGATNTSGFTALPAGIRYSNTDDFAESLGGETDFWTSTQYTNQLNNEYTVIDVILGSDVFGNNDIYVYHNALKKRWKFCSLHKRLIYINKNPTFRAGQIIYSIENQLI